MLPRLARLNETLSERKKERERIKQKSAAQPSPAPFDSLYWTFSLGDVLEMPDPWQEGQGRVEYRAWTWRAL